MPRMTPATAAYFGARAHLLGSPQSRRDATRNDPMLFAMLYLPKHLTGEETGSQISFAECHHQWYADMTAWATPVTKPRQVRHIYVAPRACAKTTTWFLLAPMWAAAHGHTKFVAAFAHSATQAEQHLATFKAELESNELLRRDFPDLCTTLKRSRGTAAYDSRAMLQMSNGFVFAARGADASSLGLKVGERRPDLIILDDIEPGEANYSTVEVERRQGTISNAILPLNEYARVVWVGTVTRPDSLIHQAVKSLTSNSTPAEWITDDRWSVSYHLPILTSDDGSERSLWPEKWALSDLRDWSRTRSYQMNYLNQPVPTDAAYWSAADIRYGKPEGEIWAATLVSVDPAVTTRRSSDFSGLSVISRGVDGTLYVRECLQVKMAPTELAAKAAQLADAFDAQTMLVETNQGGETWRTVFGPVCQALGLRYVEVKNTVKKEIRAVWLLNAMQRGQVLLTHQIPELEMQMKLFPNGLHDDMIDTVSSVVAQNPEIVGKKRGRLKARVV